MLTHWKRLWCWEGLWARGEGVDRGWDSWMASPTCCTYVWVNSGNWWWTGTPGVLRFMELQRVGHNWVTELNWIELNERNQRWHIQMERYSMFLGRKNKYCENDYATKCNLQIQCDRYQITNGIFHRTRANNFTIHMALWQKIHGIVKKDPE